MRSRESFLYCALVLLPLGEGVLCPLWRPGVTWHCPSSVSCSSQRALASTADSTVIEMYIGWQFPQSAYTAKTGPDVLSQSLFILVNTAARYPIVHSYILPLPMLIPGNSFFGDPIIPIFCMLRFSLFFFLIMFSITGLCSIHRFLNAIVCQWTAPQAPNVAVDGFSCFCFLLFWYFTRLQGGSGYNLKCSVCHFELEVLRNSLRKRPEH